MIENQTRKKKSKFQMGFEHIGLINSTCNLYKAHKNQFYVALAIFLGG